VLPLAALLPLATLALMLTVQAFAVLALAGLVRQRLGGQTGDVLGAAQQLAELAGLLAICAMLAG